MATTTSPFFPYCRRIRHESVRTDRQLSDDVRRPPARATTTTTTMMMMMMISIVIRGFPDRAARYIVSDETISFIEAYVDDSSYCNHHTSPPPRARGERRVDGDGAMLLSSHPERDCDLRAEVSRRTGFFVHAMVFVCFWHAPNCVCSKPLVAIYSLLLSKMLCQLLYGR